LCTSVLKILISKYSKEAVKIYSLLCISRTRKKMLRLQIQSSQSFGDYKINPY
jgi:hypothetical protein